MKDKYYLESCEDGREMAQHGIQWTQETVEARAEDLRELDLAAGPLSTE